LNISILSIGDELLSGDTINTNFSWISSKVSELGIKVDKQVTCQDKELDINNALDFLLVSKPGFVITTGGLGPTEDDVTRSSLFKYFNVEEKFDYDYWEKLKSSYNKMNMKVLISNKSQAIVPNKGEVIDNPKGSARGYSFYKNNTEIIILPGIPLEMKVMMQKFILPKLVQNLTKPIFRKTLRTTGYPESILAEKIGEIIKVEDSCKIGYYPSAYGVDIRISSTSEIKLEKFHIGIRSILKEKIFSLNNDSIEKVIIDMLSINNKTISIAESCTGGLIGDRITNIPGSSKVFSGGFITYSNQSKSNHLEISSNLIKDSGAVSKIVAKQMSERIREKFNTSYGLAITGIAGPGGGSEDKPVGTVFISISDKNRTLVNKFLFGNDRAKNKIKISQAAFNMLRLFI